jgi:hypothetical protein
MIRPYQNLPLPLIKNLRMMLSRLRIKLAGLVSCLWAAGEASNPVIAKKATRLEKVTIAIVISKDER